MAVLRKINTVFLLSENTLEFLSADFDSPKKTEFPPCVLRNEQVINKIRLEELVVEFIDSYSDKKRNAVLVVSDVYANNLEIINSIVKILEAYNYKIISVIFTSVFKVKNKKTVTSFYNRVLNNEQLVSRKNILSKNSSFLQKFFSFF